MDRATLSLSGTFEAASPLQWHGVGDWHLGLDRGEVRYLSYCGQEVLRGIAFLARDENWGVHPFSVGKADLSRDKGGLQLDWHARVGPVHAPAVQCRFRLALTRNRVCLGVHGTVLSDLRTARTGFVVLHPIAGFVGRALEVRGPGSGAVTADVSAAVSPSQPFRNIGAMSFDLPDHHAEILIELEADHPFEMEDQRNWTDASFKTYYRPLALPWPYVLKAGACFQQSVQVTVRSTSGGGKPDLPSEPASPLCLSTAPEIGLVWLEGTVPAQNVASLRATGAQRLTVQIDLRDRPASLRRAEVGTELARDLGLPLHLRLVLPDDGDPHPALLEIASAAGPVSSVHALPAAFLKSYQPEGPWPVGLSCADALRAAQRAFPGAEMVEGMLTFFTELNRHPPRAGGGAVSFSTAAIVHAADDRSVMETLEALPSVFATAAALAQGRRVDVGLAALAMWANPYGAALVENPNWVRRAMTDRDPRSRGLFGAAWMLGYLAHATRAGLRTVGVGCVNGPLGLLPCAQDGAEWHAAFPAARVRPMALAIRAFRELGSPVAALVPRHAGDAVVLFARGFGLAANTGPDTVTIAVPRHRITAARVLDGAALPEALSEPDWLCRSPDPVSGPLVLPPYAVASIRLVEE